MLIGEFTALAKHTATRVEDSRDIAAQLRRLDKMLWLRDMMLQQFLTTIDYYADLDGAHARSRYPLPVRCRLSRALKLRPHAHLPARMAPLVKLTRFGRWKEACAPRSSMRPGAGCNLI